MLDKEIKRGALGVDIIGIYDGLIPLDLRLWPTHRRGRARSRICEDL